MRAVIGRTLRGLAKTEIHKENLQEIDWVAALRMQAGARTIAWVTWWGGRTTVEDSRSNVSWSRCQRTIDVNEEFVEEREMN